MGLVVPNPIVRDPTCRGISRTLKEEEEEEIMMKPNIKSFLTDESGQDMVEYSLMIVLIGAVVLIYLTGMGLNLSGILQKIGDKLETVSAHIP
jgi:Flp pilus assembly pilin Flp